jgi:TolB-like protein
VKKFLKELKRRSVFNVGAIYLVVSWLVFQVAIAVAPALMLPEWIDTLVIFLLGLGFPIALILAWAYNLVPSDVQTSDAEDSGEATEVKEIPFLPPESSIAVLPFVNMSDDPAQEFFSDGISEELLNGLAKIGAFRVAARTSSFRFKEKKQDIPKIGKSLNVGHVLEGSVRKAEDTLRITAQLISVETGYHIWSETYDRKLEDVFAIQDEISAAIVDALREHILGEKPLLEAAQRIDVRAFEFYLQAKRLVALRGQKNVGEGKGLYEQALEIAPDFVAALAGLGEATLLLSDHPSCDGTLPLAVATAEAKKVLDKALSIDPHSAEAHTALAYLFGFNDDPGAALLHVDLALEANPSSSDAYGRQAFARYNSGNPNLSELQSHKRAIELDPGARDSWSNFSFRMGDRLNERQVDRAANQVTALGSPTIASLFRADALVHKGQVAEALNLLCASTKEFGPAFRCDKLATEAIRILRQDHELEIFDPSVDISSYLTSDDRHGILSRCHEFAEDDSNHFRGFPAFKVLAQAWDGKEDEAKALLELYFEPEGWGQLFLLQLVAVVPAQLARLRRSAGDESGALQMIAKLNEFYSVETRHPDGTYMAIDLLGAAIAMLEGNEDLALDRLEQQRDRVWYVLAPLRADPIYNDLHGNPRFEALNDAVDARIALERTKVTEMGLVPYGEWLITETSEEALIETTMSFQVDRSGTGKSV